MNDQKKLSPLEEGLLTALRAIDNQIAREMQRSPAELEKFGVQKWEPFNKRIELITSFILDMLGNDQIQLDSLLVVAQSACKALSLTVQDLEEKGLGKIRSAYCREALKAIEDDCYRATRTLRGNENLN